MKSNIKKPSLTGTELISKERERQMSQEGWDAQHDSDDFHSHGEMAMVACCYAAPDFIYTVIIEDDRITWRDPYDWTGWDEDWDKRKRTVNDNIIPNCKLPNNQRIRNLVKAGALIAAEIDRLQCLRK